jgi:RNA polymerase sigma factor (sigma-70 family)
LASVLESQSADPLRASTKPSAVAAQSAALWQEYRRTREPAIRNRLVLQHLGLVYRIANQYAALAPEAKDDLIQEGCLALIRAVERFRPEYGLQFSTYAFPVISGIIKNYLRERRRSSRQMSWDLGREDGEGEYGVSLVDTLVAPADLEGLPTSGGFGSGAGRDFTDRVVERILTESLLGRIPARERQLLHRMFYEDLTQREIARQLARSTSRVSRLIRRALGRIRSLLLEVQMEDRRVSGPLVEVSPFQSASVVDEETGLFSLAHLHRCLSREIKRADAYHGPLTVALMRPGNGPETPSPALLTKAAEAIYRQVRVLDHVFRAGPSELALVFPLPPDQVLQICQRVSAGAAELVLLYVVVSYPHDGDDAARLLDAAGSRLRPL